MNGKTTTAFSLATLLVLVVAGYRWWISSRADPALVDVAAHETVSEPDSIEPAPLAEPEPVSFRSLAIGPAEEPPPARSVEIAAGETEVLALTLESRDLEVTVVDESDAPIEGAVVLLGASTLMPLPADVGRTDARGKLAIRAAPLACTVAAIKNGYSPSRSYYLRESSPLKALRIVLGPPGGVLEGCVIGPDGAEVSRAHVDVHAKLEEEDHRSFDADGFLDRDGLVTHPTNFWPAVADSAGCFRLQLPPGNMQLGVQSDDPHHAPWTGSFVIISGAVTRLDVRLEPAAQCMGTVRTSLGELSSGTKVEGSSGGLRVGSVETDELGAFLLGHIPSGELVLSARAADGSSARAVLFVRGGESVQQDLDLADVQVFRGRVVDAQGDGLRGMTVIAMSGSGTRSANTNATGAFAITEVPERGVVQLIVQKNGADVARQALELPIDEPVLVRIDELALGSIQGRIVDASGTAIGHARIMRKFVGGSPGPYTPIELSEMGSGTFAIRKLVEGSYVVVVEAPGFESSSMDVSVRRDETIDLGDLVLTRRP